ncbi:galactosylceramidase [Candidatus Symbiothrix dinenymphae]|nr:galactosylceramidase [Candidatus Symbiothrix dinenymphae]
MVGGHYIERSHAYKSPEKLQQLGIPLWNTEAGPWRGDWKGFGELAKLFNRDYIEGKMTKTIIWSLITCYYDMIFQSSGLMKASTPWSGYYEVHPAIWAVAHTTQFVNPGWSYVDDGCGYLEKGSYVTLSADSKNKNFSIIIETMDAAEPQKVSFQLQNTDIKNLKVWKTTVEGDVFKQEKDLKVNKTSSNRTFTLLLSPKSVYTISTEKGQTKGISDIPESKPFPFPYLADFEGDKINGMPRYFSDQSGAFEVVEREDKKGKCLRQVITRPSIEWVGQHDVRGKIEVPSINQTVIGDSAWRDYSVKTDVCFVEPYSEAFVIGRIVEINHSQRPADAYYFRLKSSGHWRLNVGSKTLASGWLPVTLKTWNTLALSMKDTKITASINGTVLSEVEDPTLKHGMVGIGSSFHKVDFDNFQIE